MNITSLSASLATVKPVNPPIPTPSGTSIFAAVFRHKLDTNASQIPASTGMQTPTNSDQHLADLLKFQNMVHQVSPAQADNIAKNFAFEATTLGGINLRGLLPGGDGVIRYMDGTPFTGEYSARNNAFYKEAGTFQQAQIQLYESETAKGTPPAQIYDKLVNALNNQPAEFRTMMGWPLNYPTT